LKSLLSIAIAIIVCMTSFSSLGLADELPGSEKVDTSLILFIKEKIKAVEADQKRVEQLQDAIKKAKVGIHNTWLLVPYYTFFTGPGAWIGSVWTTGYSEFVRGFATSKQKWIIAGMSVAGFAIPLVTGMVYVNFKNEDIIKLNDELTKKNIDLRQEHAALDSALLQAANEIDQ
jgi:Tfp pilus assembly protein PilN